MHVRSCLTHQPREPLERSRDSDLRVDLDEHVQRRQDVNLEGEGRSGEERRGKRQAIVKRKKSCLVCLVKTDITTWERCSGSLHVAHQSLASFNTSKFRSE